MTPAARIASAGDILDQILAGAAAEKALTNWARANRFAGSGDRAAIRDHVFDALRCLRSYAALSGSSVPSGRNLMIGALVAQDQPLDDIFCGAGHAPAPLSAAERANLFAAPSLDDLPPALRLDCPDWLLEPLTESLGGNLAEVMSAQRLRAAVFLRVNLRRISRAKAIEALQAEGIATKPHPDLASALIAVERSNKIKMSGLYLDGSIELQDLSSQAAVETLPLHDGMTVLDYCAGGGGKSLAIAARVNCTVTAHDISEDRMRDLPVRAARAGVKIAMAGTDALQARSFDLVLVDAPCSGSGTWRRTPDAKWRLTEVRLSELMALQSVILDQAAGFVRSGGLLAYMTCSLLRGENEDRVAAFLGNHQNFCLAEKHRFSPLEGGDGFFAASLTRA